MGFLRGLFGRRSDKNRAEGEQLLVSEALHPIQDNGDSRRHRHDVPYALPKDIEEGERLNLQHYLLRYAMKGNFAAPLGNQVSQILDVGSGTGIWGHEVARQFPSAHVFGLDLEPPQTVSLSATVAPSPSNYSFVQGNVLQGLPFPNSQFDFTHERMLVLGVPTAEWGRVIRELARVTRAGGWIELLELGGSPFHGGPASLQMTRWAGDFLAQRGIDIYQQERLGALLKEAGLKNVVQRNLDVPIGAWNKHLGVLMEKDILATYEALKPGICKVVNVPLEQFDQMKAALPQEWKTHQTYYRFYLVYGQV